LRIQGAPVLLALPGLSQLGKLFAQTQRRKRSCHM